MTLYVIAMANTNQVKEVSKSKNKLKQQEDVIAEPINILISTNIPDQENISLTSKVIITSSANAKLYNEYPYITSSHIIREGFLINKHNNDILDYFFIKDKFVRYTNEMIKTKDDSLQGLKQLDIINSNIKTMLRMIFNTFPNAGNVTTSLVKDEYIDKAYSMNKYSHLLINSKKYTISKVVWINDIFNHYLTKQLVKDVKEFKAWKTNETTSIKNRRNDIINRKAGIIKSWTNNSNKIILFDNIKKMVKYIQNDNYNITITESIQRNRGALDAILAHFIIIYNELWEENINIKDLFTNDVYKEDKNSRMDAITTLIEKKDYSFEKNKEFIIEMNRTADIIIKSGIFSIHSSIQNLIRDLTDNNDKLIIVDNEMIYIELDRALFGNDKYKNDNFKTLTDAINKDVQILKNMININGDYVTDNTVDKDNIDKLIEVIQTNNSSPDETRHAAGIIFDNNNIKTPKYEFYFYVDLIEGYITDDNKTELDLCAFRDDLLLIKFNQIMNDEIYELQHDPLIKLIESTTNKGTIKTDEKKGGTKKNRIFNNKTKRIVKLW